MERSLRADLRARRPTWWPAEPGAHHRLTPVPSFLQHWIATIRRSRRRSAVVEVEDAYRLWAPTYGDGNSPLLELEERLRSRLQPDCSGLRVLDIGCGRGRSLRLAQRQGAGLCLGLDPVLEMLARPVLETSPVSFLVAGRAAELPVRDAFFDVVICSLVLGHLPRAEPVLGEMARVLRPDGRAVLVVFHPEATERGWQRTFQHQATGESHAIRTAQRSENDLRVALESAGLEVQGRDQELWEGQSVLLGLVVTRSSAQ